jgi:hypothetical protein
MGEHLISGVTAHEGQARPLGREDARTAEPRVSHEPDSLASGLGVNSFQCPSETTSTLPSVTLIAV